MFFAKEKPPQTHCPRQLNLDTTKGCGQTATTPFKKTGSEPKPLCALTSQQAARSDLLKEEAQSPRCSGWARWASHCIPWVSGWMFAPEILPGGLASGLASTGAFEFARNMTKSE